MSGINDQKLERAEAKLKRLDLLIAEDPKNAVLHLRRGSVLAAVADFPRAQEALEKAISLLPRYADAWSVLGEIHARTGSRRSAKRAFRSALDIEPLTEGALAGYRAHAHALEVFAWSLKNAIQEYRQKRRRHAGCPNAEQALQEAVGLGDRGHIAEAIDALRRALTRCPGSLPFAKLLSAYLAMHGNKQQSRQLLEKMVAWWPEDAQAHFVYGVCLMTIGDQPASVAALERALTLNPDNHDIRVTLAVASKGRPPTPDLGITRSVFDSYAERFDTHLVEKLDYRVPEKLAAIFASSGRIWNRMLDLGCGTGLTGAGLRPYTRHLTGVDLSLPMIEKAKARGVYDAMYQGDCVACLQQIEATFDVMVATDVLIYIGDVTQLFRAVKLRLEPGGVFWFSIEDCEGSGFNVTMSQRYQHSLSYINLEAMSAGLLLVHDQPTDIRKENNRPVRGRLMAVERPPEFSEDSSWRFKSAAAPE